MASWHPGYAHAGPQTRVIFQIQLAWKAYQLFVLILYSIKVIVHKGDQIRMVFVNSSEGKGSSTLVKNKQGIHGMMCFMTSIGY